MTAGVGHRVALVTGAGVRVGRAIALELADAGFDLAVHYHNSEDAARGVVSEMEAKGRTAHPFRADLTRADAPQRLVADVLGAFGRLDVLVNSAASFVADDVTSIDPAGVRRQIELNLVAPMLLCSAAASALASHGDGAIVNVADARVDQPMRGYLSYTASKAGLIGLTKALARDLAPSVRVNAVSPGAVAFPENMPAGVREQIVARIPAERAGEARDVALAVRYLVCGAPFVTGQVLAVDGGRSLR